MPGQAALAALGLGSGMIQDLWQLGLGGQMADDQMGRSKNMMNFQMKKALEMWEKTGYGPTVEMMKKAGLNPGLLYGMAGAGGQTAQQPTASAPMPSTPNNMGMAMQSMAQLALVKAQKENIEADTANKLTTKPNIEADTANKVLQQVVTEYLGREAKDTYERITSPNRGIQAKTYQDELEARQGVAGTIYDLWLNGKLEEKSLAEIEQLLLQNAKTREETRNIYKTIELMEENIKGAKLDNIMKDLEMRLQKETGIDRNSPAWMKVLGRLFVELINK